MKPHKTLLILLVLLVLLFGPSLFYSENILLPGNISIKLPQAESIWSPFLKHTQNHIDTLPNLSSEDNDTIILADSLVHKTALLLDSIIDIAKPDSQQLRIVYYGDSQLEGDRITDFLRKELRKSYGGSGPGLLAPGMLVPYTRTSYIRSSPNWERYSYLSYTRGDIDHNKLGPRLSVSRFKSDDGREVSAWVKISPSNTADSYAKKYDRLRIFYGNLEDSLKLEIFENRSSVGKFYFEPVEEAREFQIDLENRGVIEIVFKGVSSPDIYGISIEGDKGIVVDNIALRGSSGTEFTQQNKENFSQTLSMLDPDLIVLHFGLNIVLNIREEYSFYENRLSKQIQYLKSTFPGSAILLIGVTDMAREDESGIHSYPNLAAIIKAQSRAAEKTGISFWDAREAMGGNDAIVEWREREPPLASNDYTHISYVGGHRLARLLLEDISSLYDPEDVLATGAELSHLIDSIEIEKDSVVDELVEEEANLLRLLAYDENKPLIFTTPGFWFFLLVLLLAYSVIFNKPLLRNSYLFLFSLLFYYKAGGLFFSLLIISTLTDYIVGWMIHRSGKVFTRRLWLALSLIVNLGMLAYFKYTWFITGAINDISGTAIPEQNFLALLTNRYAGTGFDTSSIILPVGISFFTFQTISYTLDVYRGKTAPVKNILDFGFYVSFFPQLVAGPIVRASEFIPQLYRKFVLSGREWSHAVFLIVSGLIKKTIVSDYIALNFVDRIFSDPGIYSGLENLLAVYAYGLQIYCDFSGYTDIAIGVALILGFRLPVNFNSPYKASSITDFWRRWHISLSRWLKDYLYISLGGNRKGRFRTNINLLITMLLGGLWHGAAWRFVIWGGLHGLGLVIHKMWKRIFPGARRGKLIGRAISVFLTFNFVNFCWIFFRAESMTHVRTMLERIFNGFDSINLLSFFQMYYGVLVVIFSAYILHFLPDRVKESYRGFFIKMPLIIKLVIIYIVALALYNFQTPGVQPFIYFRF